MTSSKTRNKRRQRGGRKRLDVVRQPNGQPSRASVFKGPVVPDQVVAKRAIASGVDPADTARATALLRDHRAGKVLGRLYLSGRINRRQYDAGEALELLWRKWAAMAGAPRRHPRVPTGDSRSPGRDPSKSAWQNATDEMSQVRRAVFALGAGALVLGILEDVCVDDRLPRRFDPEWYGKDWAEGWDMLRAGLDAVAKHFRIPEPPQEPKR